MVLKSIDFYNLNEMLVAIIGIDGNCEGFCLNIGVDVICHLLASLVILHLGLVRVCALVTPALCFGRQSAPGDTWGVSVPGAACQ